MNYRVSIAITLLMTSCDNKTESNYGRDDDEPVFMAMGQNNPKLAIALEQAGETLPDFIDAFCAGRHSESPFVVKACFLGEDEEDRVHIWVLLNQLHEGDLVCSPIQIPEGFSGLQEDQLFILRQEQVEDWMINVDGLIYGGYSLRLAREMTSDAEKPEFDEHIGLRDFTDQNP